MIFFFCFPSFTFFFFLVPCRFLGEAGSSSGAEGKDSGECSEAAEGRDSMEVSRGRLGAAWLGAEWLGGG